MHPRDGAGRGGEEALLGLADKETDRQTYSHTHMHTDRQRDTRTVAHHDVCSFVFRPRKRVRSFAALNLRQLQVLCGY